MVKLIAVCSPIFVAASMTAAVAGGQTASVNTAPQSGQPQQQITAVGCVTRNGTTDVDKGLRLLNMDPNGLALTSARIVRSGDNRASAVPGSAPEGANSGTIPQQTIVGGRTPASETLAFALAGDQLKALGEHVGRRVEIVGRLTSAGNTSAGNPSAGNGSVPAGNGSAGGEAAQTRGTTGSDRDATPGAVTGTREQRPAESSAHPSNELQKVEVVSFRPATGACE